MVRLLLMSLLALGAAPAAAQGGGTGQPHHGDPVTRGERNAFQLLLDRRAELGLSPDQVQRLQAIGRRLEARNAPLRERLAAERQRFLAERRAQLERMTAEERAAERERMRRNWPPPLPASMQPLADSMRAHIREAVREGGVILTPAQRQQVRQMLHEAHDRRREHGRGRRGGMGRPRRGQP